MNDPNTFDRWGDQLPNVRPVRGYDDVIDVQDGYSRYGPPAYHGEQYEGERSDEEHSVESIDSYNERSAAYQEGHNGFVPEFRQEEHTVNTRNYYAGEDTIAQVDEPYESVAPDYQSGRYTYDDGRQDDRGTVGDTVYDRDGTVYDTGTVAETDLYDRGPVYDRAIVNREYDVGGYDGVSVTGTEYDRSTIDGGGYDRNMIIDADIDRGTVRGADYDRAVYEQKVRKSVESKRCYGKGAVNETMMYDKAAMASSRRLNRRRQMASPVPSQTAMAIQARISEDSLPLSPRDSSRTSRPSLSSRSSERMKTRRSNSGTDLSHNNGQIGKHHSRESEPKIPPQRKQRGRKVNNEKAPPVRREKEYIKPIDILEFRPEPFPEADNDTFCLRDAPLYATKQKKKVRPRKPQVSESSSSDDSESSRDSKSSARSSSSSGSSGTDSGSADIKRKNKGRRGIKSPKGHGRNKKQSKKGRGNHSDSESDEEVPEKTAVGTFLNFLGGGAKEPPKVPPARRSRRKR